jgi:hypothetical protein
MQQLFMVVHHIACSATSGALVAVNAQQCDVIMSIEDSETTNPYVSVAEQNSQAMLQKSPVTTILSVTSSLTSIITIINTQTWEGTAV